MRPGQPLQAWALPGVMRVSNIPGRVIRYRYRLLYRVWTAPCDTGPGPGGTGGVLLCLVCRGGSFRPPPALCVSRGRCETRAGHLACGSRRATEPTETSGGDVASRVVWVAAARPRHRTGRLPSGGLRTPWLLSTGWSYHFLPTRDSVTVECKVSCGVLPCTTEFEYTKPELTRRLCRAVIVARQRPHIYVRAETGLWTGDSTPVREQSIHAENRVESSSVETTTNTELQYR